MDDSRPPDPSSAPSNRASSLSTQSKDPPASVVHQGNGLAVAGFVLGVTSVVFCWWGVFALVQVILAITFSAIGRGHARQGASHRGLATAGLVLGLIGAALYLMIGVLSLGAGFFI